MSPASCEEIILQANIVYIHVHWNVVSLRCVCCGVFLRLFLLPQVFGKEFDKIGVLNREFTCVSISIDGRVTRDHSRATRLHHNGGLELRHKFSFSLLVDWVGNQHIVVEALTHTNLGRSLVSHCADWEGQGRESLVDFDEESARTFHFEVIDLLELAFKDGATSFILTRLSLSTGHVDIEANDVTRGELELRNLLVRPGPVDDDIVTIDDMSLDLVGKDTFDSVALELLSHLLNYCGHFVVGGSQGNFALSSLEGVPCGQNDISLAACDCTITYNGSCGSIRSVAIEVCAAHATQRDYYKGMLSSLIGKLSVKKRSCQEPQLVSLRVSGLYWRVTYILATSPSLSTVLSSRRGE